MKCYLEENCGGKQTDTGVGQHNIFQLEKGARQGDGSVLTWLFPHLHSLTEFLVSSFVPYRLMDAVPTWVRTAKPDDLSLIPGIHKWQERTHSCNVV